jgi:hypothetical protein
VGEHSQVTQSAGASQEMSDKGEECTSNQVSTGRDAVSPRLGVTTGATRSRINFTKLGPCENISRSSQDSKSLLFCRIGVC